MSVVAILSTTVLPLDGVYSVQTANLSELNFVGVPHYIGHPATKQIVEALGAVPAPTKLFAGLQVGESAITSAIAQGQSNRSNGGTAINQEVTVEQLHFRVVTRLS